VGAVRTAEVSPAAVVRERLAAASAVAVLTGAGISAESGIPTFRGAGGLWRSFRAQDLATSEAFAADPKLVWSWYDWRRGQIAAAEPNAGHRALAQLRTRFPRFTLATQNVDGLHARAGHTDALKLHGDIWTLRCTACGREREDVRTPLPELPPRGSCGALERPGVVWFGETLPDDVWDQAQQAASEAGVFLVIGTSAVVYPAAGLVHLAKDAGAVVVEINVEETPLSHLVDICWRVPAAQALPELLV
jgi:NAD-dependent deacetylase